MGYKSLSYISDKLRANFYVTHSPITPYTSPSPLPQQAPYSPLKIFFQTVIALIKSLLKIEMNKLQVTVRLY